MAQNPNLCYKAFSQSFFRIWERMRQGVMETELEAAAARESPVATSAQPCGCSTLPGRPDGLLIWLRAGNHVKVSVPSLHGCVEGGSCPPNPKHERGTRPMEATSSPPGEAGQSPPHDLAQQDPSAACSHTTQAVQVKTFPKISKQSLPSCRLWL